MPGRYAAQTSVSSENTRLEIERTLRRYGADQFMSGWQNNSAIVGFRINERMFRISVPLPDPDADSFRYTRGGNQFSDFKKERSQRSRDNMYEQVVRTRWRALLLVLKATLEAVDVGIFTLEEALVAHTLLPNNQTVAEWAEPQIEAIYESRGMPEVLPGLPAPAHRQLREAE